jgi:cell division protein FtsN
MAHNDYVSRAPQKKKSPYKNNQPEVKQAFLPLKVKIIALMTFIFLALFSYFLWSIKDQQPEIVPQHKTNTKENKQTLELPKPPTEKWAYVKDLAERNVEVGEYEVKTKGPYKMQCGSFKTQRQAESLKAKMAFLGVESQITHTKGSIWHKVVLGPYARKRLAEKDKHKLKNNKVNNCQIRLWK